MYYLALRFICGDLNSGNGIVMQELEQLKGKEINMLRFGRGSWDWRIMLAPALIFIFNYETFSKTSFSSEQNWDSESKRCY